MSEKATIAELDDVEDKVYALGMNLNDFSKYEIDDLLELLEDRFDEADWMVLDLPMEGSVEISEMDPEEVREIMDYQNIVGDLQDPPYGEEGQHD